MDHIAKILGTDDRTRRIIIERNAGVGYAAYVEIWNGRSQTWREGKNSKFYPTVEEAIAEVTKK